MTQTMWMPSPSNTADCQRDDTTVVSSRDSALPLEFKWLGEVPYEDAWEMQERATAERKAQVADPARRAASTDTVFLLTHPAVYTAGRMTESSDLPDDGSPVISVNRGGRITWHGPGQLIGYPIIKLAEPLEVMSFVRRTEEALLRVVQDYGIPAGRVDGRSGVWVPSDRALGIAGERPERKICALGYHLTKGVSQHGFALNCCNELSAYERIVPCGITDAGVTTLTLETGHLVTPEDVVPAVQHYFQLALDGLLPLTDGEIPR